MKTKKKLFLAIGAFSILVLAAVVAVVAVLAAQSVTVTSGNVTVSYTSLEVKANITASYQIKNGSKTAWKTDDNKDTISFNGTEQSVSETTKSLQSLTIPTGQMTSTNNYIDFIFKFENKGSTTCKVVLIACPGIGADDTMDNMETKIHTSTTESYTMPDDASAPSGGADYLTLESNKTGYVIIRYSITDVASNASLSGSFDWMLEKAQ